MSLNSTPRSERTHIAFVGKRNAGKSSLVNAVTGQDMSIVSSTLGTTSDPVSKAMELLPLGPVVIVDTPGYDDDDPSLGGVRIERAKRVLAKTDIVVVVMDVRTGRTVYEDELIAQCEERKIPYVCVYTHSDLMDSKPIYPSSLPSGSLPPVYVSSLTGDGVQDLKNLLASLGKKKGKTLPIVSDIIESGDVVVLVVPIDESAPKGRLILPQVQTLRDILDAGAIGITVKETELEGALRALSIPPALVITDSQVFGEVARIVPESIPLTSFSILMARHKGFLNEAVRGVAALKHLESHNRVLIAEGCTHDRKCNDIATVKLPRLIEKTVGASIDVRTSTGFDFPDDLSGVATVIHCGGCMLNGKEMEHRRNIAHVQGVPLTNFGLSLAYMNGVLKRSLEIFPELAALV
ncbi:MAG: [FeFe] hydrogenase H-cluster maturation GTPase HydF [Actinomycetaceae bacterium]|nr:[FeFe] hydrogenase H-cluster maturation GTPase HydF [Actinomycetaceae bacterium]